MIGNDGDLAYFTKKRQG